MGKRVQRTVMAHRRQGMRSSALPFHALKRYLHRLPPRCWLQRLQTVSKLVST